MSRLEILEKVGSAEFDNSEEANRRVAALEAEGFDQISIVRQMPHVYVVSWGRMVTVSAEEAYADALRMLARSIRREEAEKEARFTKECERIGYAEAGRVAAQSAGYMGRDAEIYAAGFAGQPASWVNPRAEGREAIFRAGRNAACTPDGQRAKRAAAVVARNAVSKELV